jgi:hypothetical protein
MSTHKEQKPSKNPSDTARREGAPPDVAAIRRRIREILRGALPGGRTLGNTQWGVYAFYDFDEEPIYVGQTREGIGGRISRHLTGQRSDAVAKNVLDPFEVAAIRIWPLDLRHMASEKPGKNGRILYKETPELVAYLNNVEFTVYEMLVAESKFGAVLNEKRPIGTCKIELDEAIPHSIIPEEMRPQRKHPDVRIARRASTIASLARVISEREVDAGLRHVLVLQAQRLELLAKERLTQFAKDKPVAVNHGKTDA